MIKPSQLDRLQEMNGLDVCQFIEKIPHIITAFRSGWSMELLAERYKVDLLLIESVVRMSLRSRWEELGKRDSEGESEDDLT